MHLNYAHAPGCIFSACSYHIAPSPNILSNRDSTSEVQKTLVSWLRNLKAALILFAGVAAFRASLPEWLMSIFRADSR
jgi:hypothetical protein